MAEDMKCPLCQLQERARSLLRGPAAEELAACATVPLVLAALPVNLGCQLVRGGAFLFAHCLYGAKSFVDAELLRTNQGHAGQCPDRQEAP